MINRCFKGLRSLLKLCWIVLRDVGLILWALVRGQWSLAASHTRSLAGVVHEDLTRAVVALQRLLPWCRPPSADVDRILIVKLDRIGDMVNTTPVFDALRAAYPKARLDVVSHPGPLALLDGDDRIGQRIAYRSWMYHPLWILPGGPRLWGLILKLMWRRYPLVVYLRGSIPFLWLGLTSRLAAVKFVPGEAVIDRYFKALEPLLGQTNVHQRRTRLHISAEATSFAEELLGERAQRTEPQVVIHAAASVETRVWPAERFARLADDLVRTCGARVHFVGGAQDRPGLEKILSFAEETHECHTNLRLPQVTSVIAAADLFIGNDSGLSHIAAAVGTRLVVLWGSANLNMSRPAAAPGTCQIIYHDMPCRVACPETHCTNASPFECLNLIRTEEVLGAARQLLHRFPCTLPLIPVDYVPRFHKIQSTTQAPG